MKILDGDKEAHKYQIKQAVKYIFLSAFFGIGFFFLGMLIYKINSEEGFIAMPINLPIPDYTKLPTKSF